MNFSPKYILALLLSVLINCMSAQDQLICFKCKKSITGSYVKIDDKIFHPQHFVCEICKKPINDAYKSQEDKYFHLECYSLKEGLICDYCKKILRGSYKISNDKKYHLECYEEFIVPKCAICSSPLNESFVMDIYSNKYHVHHADELKKCSCCSRLISQKLTGGGRQYSDGRNICNLCYGTAVKNSWQAQELLGKVTNRLKMLGLKIDEKNISISAVDKNTLSAKTKNFSDNTHGFCDTQIRTESINNKIVSNVTKHRIYVLTGMPAVLTESTIAHELMHAWIHDNTENDHPDKVREGSCNFVAYKYLISLNPPSRSASADEKVGYDSPSLAAEQGSGLAPRFIPVIQNYNSDFIKLMENDPDPIYGKGFLEIKSRFSAEPLNELLDFLKR